MEEFNLAEIEKVLLDEFLQDGANAILSGERSVFGITVDSRDNDNR